MINIQQEGESGQERGPGSLSLHLEEMSIIDGALKFRYMRVTMGLICAFSILSRVVCALNITALHVFLSKYCHKFYFSRDILSYSTF